MLPTQICNFKKQVFHSHNIQSICPRLIKGLRCTVEVSVNAGSRSAPSCLLNYNYVLVLCPTYLRQSTSISIFVQIQPCTSTFVQLQLCTSTLFNLFVSTIISILSKYDLVPVSLFNYNYVLVLCSTYLRQILLVFLPKLNLVRVPLFNYKFDLVNLCNLFASTILHHSNFYCRNRVELWLSALNCQKWLSQSTHCSFSQYIKNNKNIRFTFY